ncbi:MAG: sulfite exporter TauE/SafE family protein [Nitrososphaeria archaeon]
MTNKIRIPAAKIVITILFGFLTGIAAGLIGVGGGEFRLPILLYVLGVQLMPAIVINLLVGLLTVTTSFLQRFKSGLLNEHMTNIAFAMSLGSIVGSYLGARLTNKIPEKPLKKVLAIILIVVGLKIGFEPFVQPPFLLQLSLGFIEEAVLATFIGIVIGVISGLLGVAGGEFRIPALIYLFNLNIVNAGTTSLLVSIPTVAIGFLKHHRMGHVNKETVIIATTLAIGSVIGALVGASYANVVDKEILKVLLGIILILAVARMITRP